MERQLREVGSTALMVYFVHFWQADKDGKYFKSVSWEDIYRLYEFNGELSCLLKRVGDKVETAFREQVAYQMEQAYDCYWHYKEDLFKEPCERTLQDGQKVIRSTYGEIQKFSGVYFRQHGEQPFRRMMYSINFRQIFHLYASLKRCRAKELVAEAFGIPHVGVFESCMFAIEELRNFYSHLNPMWAKRYNGLHYSLYYSVHYDWLKSQEVENNNLYYRLCLLNYFLQAFESDYPYSTLSRKLLDEYANRPLLYEMGFTEDWEEESMWKCK